MIIIGVGNSFRGDDGAGLIAASRLRDRRPQLRIAECDGDMVGLMDRWLGEDVVIVIDAVASGVAPGTVHRLDASTQPLATGFFRGSTHAFGVAELVELARALGRLPRRLIVFGIEGADFAPGAPLSPPVKAGIDVLVDQVLEEATRHARDVTDDRSDAENRTGVPR